MNRDSASAYVHIMHDTPPPLYAIARILDDPPSPLLVYVLNGCPLSDHVTIDNYYYLPSLCKTKKAERH